MLSYPEAIAASKMPIKKPPEGGFFCARQVKITWKQRLWQRQQQRQQPSWQRHQQVRQKQRQQVLQKQLERVQQRVLVQVQELLLFCHKRPEQQQRSRR